VCGKKGFRNLTEGAPDGKGKREKRRKAKGALHAGHLALMSWQKFLWHRIAKLSTIPLIYYFLFI